ncbi:hypothetical protein DEA98_00990 [Brucella pseudogrignonensis]|nr:hypothetical protein [Brucella pseudogrignonensis]
MKVSKDLMKIISRMWSIVIKNTDQLRLEMAEWVVFEPDVERPLVTMIFIPQKVSLSAPRG